MLVYWWLHGGCHASVVEVTWWLSCWCSEWLHGGCHAGIVVVPLWCWCSGGYMVVVMVV